MFCGYQQAPRGRGQGRIRAQVSLPDRDLHKGSEAVAWCHWAQRWLAELVPSSKYDVVLRHKLHTAIFHTNSLSPSLESPDVQCCAQLTKTMGCLPQGCVVRGGVLPGGQGDQVARAGLEGLKGLFLQWLPGLLSGPREKAGGW